MAKRTYLDHNATAPLRPLARDAILAVLEHPGNASSVHYEGRAARQHIDDAREIIARYIATTPDMVTFTSGGTEAANLAIRGVVGEEGIERVIISAIEHPCVMQAATDSGAMVEIVAVDGDGVVDLVALEELLRQKGGKTLVSIMLANNETGVIEPVAKAAALAQGYGALIHCDAVQALGRIPVNMAVLGVDMLSVSAHKLGGPQGVGALLARPGLKISPLNAGGGQERNRRGGTENVIAVTGFAAAVQDAENDGKIISLRHKLESELQSYSPNVTIFSAAAERLPNTLCFAVAGLEAETALMRFDLAGIALSSGSACSSGKVAQSHVLAAMGIAPQLAKCALRLSMGWNTTAQDIDNFIANWRETLTRLNVNAA